MRACGEAHGTATIGRLAPEPVAGGSGRRALLSGPGTRAGALRQPAGAPRSWCDWHLVPALIYRARRLSACGRASSSSVETIHPRHSNHTTARPNMRIATTPLHPPPLSLPQPSSGYAQLACGSCAKKGLRKGEAIPRRAGTARVGVRSRAPLRVRQSPGACRTCACLGRGRTRSWPGPA